MRYLCTSRTSRIGDGIIQLLALYRLHKQQLCLRVEEVELRGFLEKAAVADELLLKFGHLSKALKCDKDVIGFLTPYSSVV